MSTYHALWRLLCSWLIAAALTFAVEPETPAGASNVRPADSVCLLPDRAVTDWSELAFGLQMRVRFTPTVGRTDPIDLEIELRADSEGVSLPSFTGLSSRDSATLTLRLTDLRWGREPEYRSSQAVIAFERTASVGETAAEGGVTWHATARFKVDCEPRVVDLAKENPDSVRRWRQPRTALVHESLPTGSYDARLEVISPQSAGNCWHGLLVSAPFHIEVAAGDCGPSSRQFVFPRSLRLEPGPVIGWDPEDVDTIQVESDPCNFLQYVISSKFGNCSAPGLPEPPLILLDRSLPWCWREAPLALKPEKRVVFVDGACEMTFHHELLECASVPGCASGCCLRGRPRSLWESDLTLSFTRSEFDSLRLRECEMYDRYTVFIPRRLRVGPDDSLRSVPEEEMLRELRCPKGYRVLTEVSVGDVLAIRSECPLRALAVVMHPVAANSVIPLRIEMHAIRPGQDGVPTAAEGSDLLLWSGNAELNAVAPEFEIEDDFSQPELELWPMRTVYIPRELRLTDDLELVAVPGDSIELSLFRCPGTALLAAVACGEAGQTQLPVDLKDLRLPLWSQYPWNDSLTYRLDLYEQKIGSTDAPYARTTLWRHEYLVGLSQRQVVHIRRHPSPLRPAPGPAGYW